VDNQANARLVNSSFTTNVADSSSFTLSLWLYPQTATAAAAHRIFQLSLATTESLILLSRTSGAGTLTLVWGYNVGTGNFQKLSGVVTGNVSDGWHHIFITGNTNGNTDVYVDGVSSYSAAVDWPGADVSWSSMEQIGICSGHIGGNVGDYQLADLFFRTNYLGSVNTFYNGGTPPDISAIGAQAEVFISGNAAVWNAGTNSGIGLAAAGGPTLTLTNTFADV
jgi:hypothetical protein